MSLFTFRVDAGTVGHMSPAGGNHARRLRGSTPAEDLDVTCTCGKTYMVTQLAIDLGVAKCPDKACGTPTSQVLGNHP